jgi:hypothetical protein
MVRLTAQDGKGAVNLFEQQHLGQPMGQSHLRKGKTKIRLSLQSLLQPVRASDDKIQLFSAPLMPRFQTPGKAGRAEQSPSFIQRDDQGPGLNFFANSSPFLSKNIIPFALCGDPLFPDHRAVKLGVSPNSFLINRTGFPDKGLRNPPDGNKGNTQGKPQLGARRGVRSE